MIFIFSLVHNSTPYMLGSMSRRGYFPHGEGGGGGGVFQGMVAAAAAAVFVSLCLMQTLCTTLGYSTWRATVWMLFRAVDHRDDGMPDPHPEDAYFFPLDNFPNAAFLWGIFFCLFNARGRKISNKIHLCSPRKQLHAQ